MVKGLINGVIRIYIEPLPSYASYDISSGIDTVVAELERTQLDQLRFQRVYNPNDSDIYISWIKDYGSHTVGEAIFKSHIKVGLGTANCYGEWSPLDAHTILLIFVHELGHSMGFGHSNDPNNIMYYQTPTRFSVDYDKNWTLDEGQLVDISFCSAGTYSYSISSNDSSNGFYAYILPPNTDSTSFLEGSGNYYPSCSGTDSYVTFSGTCTVPAGAKLLVYNKDDILEFNAINVNVQIVDIGERITPNLEWDYNAFEYDEEFLDEVWNMYH